MTRRWLASIAAVALAASTSTALGASTTSTALGAAASAASPSTGSARLDGQFLLTGTVTAAVRIRGEHVGDSVRRTWTFTAMCPSGPCSRIKLVRQRTAGTDTLVLKRISPGYYEGNDKFYARLRCAGRLYYRGESVPFTIQVHVTAAALVNNAVLATRIRASYTNRSRRNRTPCIAIPGHDAAKYHGHLVKSPLASDGSRGSSGSGGSGGSGGSSGSGGSGGSSGSGGSGA